MERLPNVTYDSQSSSSVSYLHTSTGQHNTLMTLTDNAEGTEIEIIHTNKKKKKHVYTEMTQNRTRLV